jgi:hypothetical protein
MPPELRKRSPNLTHSATWIWRKEWNVVAVGGGGSGGMLVVVLECYYYVCTTL